MIASVRGPVVALAPDGVVVEVGGIGLSVQCTPGTLARLRVGEPARLATSLVVREDSLTLYGFADDDERSLFELLQTASGVGPRLAQAILGVLPPAEARLAIVSGDVRTLIRVPGIGKKGAERLVVELRDRIGPVCDAGVPGVEPGAVTPVQPWRDQVRQALVGLGWSAREADEAVEAVADQAGQSTDVPALLRSALRLLGRP
ncbi:MAG TPA: Holliday junction branch migration protein RuvA [Mycobacteriales bacterium]|nr:Holliday junction branch migration protein RuvA [Mycobacteriales bacterium]